MIVRGKAAAVGISLGISAAAIMGASTTPVWAGPETTRPAAMFGSNGALDASSLEGIHSGLAPSPGDGKEEELRRKRPGSSDTDPLKANRDAASGPRKSDLSSPFTATLTLNGAPLNQPAQNPPAATNPPPANNPPATNNPQNTVPIANNSPLSSVTSATSAIAGTVTTLLRRNGLLQ